MNQHSLEMLEFPRIKEMLAGYTAFAISREMALALGPSTDVAEVVQRLNQSAEARHLLAIEPDTSVGNVYDIRETVVLAARGKILELQALLDVQRTLTSIRYLHTKLSHVAKEAPLLARISSNMVPLEKLEKEIARCISPSAELLDSASERLLELRRLIKEQRTHILSRLDSILKNPDNERYIQESLVTEREGRYVIPVKVELRREMKGIVHDISNTGATAFVEPLATVDLGNELREMVIEERNEVERILGELSAAIGAEEDIISLNLRLVAQIDLALAKARFADRIKAVEPLISGAEADGLQGPPERTLRLINARHPLLKGKPVPLTIELGKDYQGLVITGPNTGGKTVALKTMGLLALMAQAGLPIPAAHESCVPLFDNIFADIGDEQSIEQTLSTFSWHMGNIVNILKESTTHSLVLLDELGTSTDPAEGAALAQSILLHFLKCGTMIVATTHFGELKAFAHATPGLQNASLDFDPVTLKPTYHMTLGIPGGSNALAIAAQLGLPEEVIAGARERLSKGSQEIEVLLSDLMLQKQELDSLRAGLEKEKQSAETLRRGLEKQQEEFREQERRLLRQTREKLAHEGDELLKEIRDAISDLRKNRTSERIEKARQALSAMREKLKTPEWQPVGATPSQQEEFSFKVGDRVWLRNMNLEGTIEAPPDSAGQLEVRVGNTRIRMMPENLDKAQASGKSAPAARPASSMPRKVVARELDLRGKRADEVEPELDAYLNDASLSNLSEVRVIHGVATGTVRQIVRQALANHPLVSSFRSGKREEGGDGVTIVKL